MKIHLVAFQISLLLTVGCANSCKMPPYGNDPISLISRSRISAALTYYDSCATLETDLKQHYKAELRELLTIQKSQSLKGGGVIALSSDSGAVPPKTGGTEGVDFSGTNNQEQGVDEADIVKTDGNFIYTINGNMLEILSVPEFGKINYLSNITISGFPTGLLIAGDKALVFSQEQNSSGGQPLLKTTSDLFMTFSSATILSVVDLSPDRTQPKISRELKIDGTYNTARKLGSKTFMVSYFSPNISGLIQWAYLQLPPNFDYNNKAQLEIEWNKAIDSAITNNDTILDNTKLDSFVPHIYQKTGANFEQLPLSNTDCQNFAAATDAISRGFNSIISLDLQSDSLSYEADHIMSNSGTVYASESVLLIAEQTEQPWWFFENSSVEEATNIHRFAISQDGTTKYSGSGRINGTVLNQFSLSEYQGNVRVVTTSGRFNRWFEPNASVSENHLFVLAGDNKLDTIGQIDGISKGERIWSARFLGDKGYLITFRNTDPLFTIDLKDPANPKLIGELKTPGVATYIHPLGDNNLLTVGFGGNEQQLDWKTNVGLYDITDFTRPKQSDELSLVPTTGNQDAWSWSNSEANYEHKAITYWPALGKLAIPLSTQKVTTLGTSQKWEYVSKLVLINAAPGKPLAVHGEISHSDFYNSAKSDNYINPDIRRSIFMGDFIYAISAKGITVHEISTMQQQDSTTLKGY